MTHAPTQRSYDKEAEKKNILEARSYRESLTEAARAQFDEEAWGNCREGLRRVLHSGTEATKKAIFDIVITDLYLSIKEKKAV